MTTIVTHKGRRLALLVFGLLAATGAGAQESPHWSKKTCQECHVEAAPVEGNASLKAADVEGLCESCHGDRGDAVACRHRSGLAASEMKIADTLQPSLKDGQVVCSTCHDTVYQCKHARIQYSYQNPGFLRDRTSRRTSQYCYKCHEESAYAELNPHDGVAGSPPKATCLLCHQAIPETGESGDIDAAFNMLHDLNDTCQGCHNVGPHPRNQFGLNSETEWIHLVVPSAKILANLQTFAAKTGTEMPLHPETGEIFCSTCHNQHGFMGEAPEQQPKHRLRANDICQACHDK